MCNGRKVCCGLQQTNRNELERCDIFLSKYGNVVTMNTSEAVSTTPSYAVSHSMEYNGKCKCLTSLWSRDSGPGDRH